MKKLFGISLTTLVLMLASCASDKSDDPLAPSSSTSDDRDKFVGAWTANETSALIGGQSSHTVNISKSTAISSQIQISNFYGITSSSVRATVNNNNISIPYQSVTGGFVIGGSGTMTNATTINLTYTTAIGTDRDSCSTVYIKQ